MIGSMCDVLKIHGSLIKHGVFWFPDFRKRILVSCVALAPKSLDYARSVFSGISNPDTFEWNTVMRAHSEHSPTFVFRLFSEMHARGVIFDHFTLTFVLKACTRLHTGREFHSFVVKLGFNRNIFVKNALINVYGCCGSSASARNIFEEMLETDIISWSSMISCLVNNGSPFEAITTFRKMQLLGSITPDRISVLSLLSAISDLGYLELGRWAHLYVQKRLEFSVSLGTALIDMYSRCGSIDESVGVFNTMTTRNILTWTALINGLGVHGRSEQALLVFSTMKKSGFKPDPVSFTGVLVACSHGGLLGEGWEIFKSIYNDFGIQPTFEHYGCIADLLCRVGLVYEAYKFVQALPITPNVVIWRTLLGACVNHNRFELIDDVKDVVGRMDPLHDGDFVLLSNAYGGVARWGEKETIRKSMCRMKIMKKPGCSWVIEDHVVHEFAAGQNSHPHFQRIRKYLVSLISSLRQTGYYPDTSNVLFDVEQEEKEHSLAFHSEKYALAFALLSFEDKKTIRIMKNLRICSDCHCFIKHVSNMFNREIIVRDRSRFHHFCVGKCSCHDFW